MRREAFVYLSCCLLVVLPGCKKTHLTKHVTAADEPTDRPASNVCGLMTEADILGVQGSSIKEAKSSSHANAGLRMARCLYTLEKFDKSIRLEVTQNDPASPVRRSAREFWEKTFSRYDAEEKEREGEKDKKESLKGQRRDRDEEEEGIPPRKIDGIGDEAYWVTSREGGALCVLRNNTFIRLILGGSDNEETKISKSKTLAKKVLDRL